MSLQPLSVQRVREETARVARAAFPKGNPYLRRYDALAACRRERGEGRHMRHPGPTAGCQ